MRPDHAFFHEVRAKEAPLTKDEALVYRAYLNNSELREERITKNQLIRMNEFGDVYPKDELSADKNEVMAEKEEKKIDFTERGEIFEFLMRESEKFNWFGEDCYIVKTSKYDDIKNYTDIVIEWEDEDGQIVRLAIDCTVAKNEDNLRKKAYGIKRKLESGDLSSLKYHQSELSDEKRLLTQIPQVVVAIEPEKITDLCRIFTRVINKDKGSKDDFSKCNVQFVLLKEIEEQLRYQNDRIMKILFSCPENKRKHYASAQKSILKTFRIINKIIEEKKHSLGENLIQGADSELAKNGFYGVFGDASAS